MLSEHLIAGGCTLGFCRRRAFRRLRRAAFLRFACGALSRSSFALSSFTLSRLACGGFLSRSVLRALGLVLRSSHIFHLLCNVLRYGSIIAHRKINYTYVYNFFTK